MGLRGAWVVVAIAVLVLLPGCESSSPRAGAHAHHFRSPPSRVPARPAAAAVTPAPAQARPPRAPRVTMRVVRRYSRAQRFRTYTGPRPPAFSEAAALRRARGAHDYSLGLWDVGLVHVDSSVDWHSVWIIADQTFVEDIDRFVTGPYQPSAAPNPHIGRPGWSRSVTMLDARTGRFVRALTF
jgi:hypothetical protein